VQVDDRMLRKTVCGPTKCDCHRLKRVADPGTSGRDPCLCPRNLVRARSADLDGFLRGLALCLNEGIETMKGSTRHVHLDVNGMDIDVEPEDLTTNGESIES
jgi:hypothetical protein